MTSISPEAGGVLARLRKLQKQMESGKHYGFQQDIWQVAADEIERLQTRIQELEMQSRGNWIDAEQLSRALTAAQADAQELSTALDAAIAERDGAFAQVDQVRASLTAEAEHRAKLVDAIRELHPSTGCDPYEPCQLCNLAEYT